MMKSRMNSGSKNVSKTETVPKNELRWLREVALLAPAFRDAATEVTRSAQLPDVALIPFLKAKIKLEGALNELRLAREETSKENGKCETVD